MRVQTVQITCDFCGYGGPLSRPEDFAQHGDVDLCHWCRMTRTTTPGVRMQCGRHEVTFAEDSWACSCGEASTDWKWKSFLILRPPAVVAALPNVLWATARIHSEER